MITYTQLVAESKAFGENNDCAVKMVATVTDCGYTEAHKALAAQGRRKGRGTYPHQYVNAIAGLGFKVKKIELTSKTMASAKNELARNYAGRKVLMRVRRHVAGWNGVEIVDWAKDSRRRIIEAYEVVAKGRAKPEAPKTEAPKPEAPKSRARSEVTSPVRVAWETFDARRGDSRKELIAAAIAQGVNPSTAATQYSKWKKARGM